ncbi:MAG: ABC transporter permease, partial [Candidatus Dormibacteraeota bacterium]|nr:ABC transporter permease [Candidatus Dormibacteraeota bacterium]
RKVRSALTISGIVIGIFALTTMGSLAEHFNSLLDLGVRYAGATIPVQAPPEQQGALLPLSRQAQIAKVQGVAAVYPTYQVPAKPGGSAIQLGAPDLISNEQRGADKYGLPGPQFASGRDLASGEQGEIVLGAVIAGDLGTRTGETVDLPVKPAGARSDFVSHPFKVVGVTVKNGQTDTFAYVSDADVRMLLADTLSPAVRSAIDVSAVAQGFAVYPAQGTSLGEMDAIAQRINDQVPGVHAQKPSELVANFKGASTTFTAIFTGAAVLALIIGGLSVVNTMIMAVSERVREIGLKKALGAHTGQIVREYLLEAAVIGALGGLSGYVLGYGLTKLLDVLGASSNLDIFLVTPRLTAIALGFAIGMATLAGILPALRAARLDPVTALRSL